MTAFPVDIGAVQKGDFVHLQGCAGDLFLEVLTAPAGKMYVEIKLLGIPRWVHRSDLRDAMRPVGNVPKQAIGPVLDLPGLSGGVTGT